MSTNSLPSPFLLLPSRQKGISLIELIMFIAIISIALAGIMLVMDQTTGHSADTLLREQALTIAESRLEEIESQKFSDIASAVNNLTQVPGYSVSAVLDTSARGGIPAASAALITVTVTDPIGQTITATGYRTAY